MKKLLSAWLFFFLCSFTVTASADGEGAGQNERFFQVMDCSSDQASYGRTVAALNRVSEAGGPAASAGSPTGDPANGDGDIPSVPDVGSGGEAEEELFSAVLFKTSGAPLSPSSLPSGVPETAVYPEELLYQVNGPDNCGMLYYSSLEAARAAAAALFGRPGICYAECDSMVTACSLEGEGEEPDALSFRSWGAEATGFLQYLPYARAFGSGSATIAIIDSGVCMHSALVPRILSYGYDYVDSDDDPSNDLFGHGTHVAGIVADCTQGCPVYLYPIRVLHAGGGGSMSNVINAVREAIRQDVDVINLSIESRRVSDALDTAIRDALSAGILVVVSAGNSNCDTRDIYPAHMPDMGVLVVGAAEKSGDTCVKADYSNYGESVDIYAFGTDIISCSRSGGYVTNTGTSMAAPHMSALGALLTLIHPDLTPGDIEERIRASAVEYGDIRVPDLAGMIPTEEGFRLSSLRLAAGETLALPVLALPASSMETVSYTSSDPDIAAAPDGVLMAHQEGTAYITARCTGFADAVFEVLVEAAAPSASIHLPEELVSLEDEAFSGMPLSGFLSLPEGVACVGDRAFEPCPNLRFIEMPLSVTEIGENSFSGAVVLCEAGSFSMEYAKRNGLPYIAYYTSYT